MRQQMLRFMLALLIGFLLCGCGIRGYKFATHSGDKNDKSAGDITHVSEPGAKVVVPKSKKH